MNFGYHRILTKQFFYNLVDCCLDNATLISRSVRWWRISFVIQNFPHFPEIFKNTSIIRKKFSRYRQLIQFSIATLLHDTRFESHCWKEISLFLRIKILPYPSSMSTTYLVYYFIRESFFFLFFELSMKKKKHTHTAHTLSTTFGLSVAKKIYS